MARWFDAVRQKTARRPYLPMTLSERGEPVSRTDILLSPQSKWHRLWIQGNPGMGKTALVLDLKGAFFTDPALPTLHRAFARYRVIPIIVPLREYGHVAFDPKTPEDWIVNVACACVSNDGVPFEDRSLFRAMLRSGGFMLVLDGANEVEHDKEIDLFAQMTPAMRLLVTSQLPGSSNFTNWQLPRRIDDEIKPLLCLFLGQGEGERTYARIAAMPLLEAIRSGYDVRLIADLVQTQGPDVRPPEDRLGLYELILAAIKLPDGRAFPDESLSKAAWTMWRDGERKLKPGKHLDQDLLDPLIQNEQKVLRISDGKEFEFRHDQMRAFLAARWAARHETQPISLFEKEAAIWRLSRKEQGEVWDFFAEMYAAERPDDASALWEWSTAHPDRVILQHALQRVLERAGRAPQMPRATAAAPREEREVAPVLKLSPVP